MSSASTTSPGLSRWLARDPLGPVDGPNMHAYVRANPIAYVDPEGGSVLGVIGGRRGDWFDRTAEYFGRCVGPAALFAAIGFGSIWAGVPTKSVLVHTRRFGLVEKAAARRFRPEFVVGGGIAVTVGGVVENLTGVVSKPFREYTDRMMGDNPDYRCF